MNIVSREIEIETVTSTVFFQDSFDGSWILDETFVDAEEKAQAYVSEQEILFPSLPFRIVTKITETVVLVTESRTRPHEFYD